jgi:RNA polymerase sigma-70 factor (ECF subfamily)
MRRSNDAEVFKTMDYEICLPQQGASFESAEQRDTDVDLVRAMSDGEPDAWDRFFERFLPWAYRFAYYHLRENRADAEDLSSDILLTAARSIKKYNATRGCLDIWLLGIARHRLAHYCRRRRIELPLTPEVIDSFSSDHSAGEFENTVLAQEQVYCILASLPERQSSVLIGRYLEGYSTEELARDMKSTPKAIEMLLRRARSAFRKALDAVTEGDDNER